MSNDVAASGAAWAKDGLAVVCIADDVGRLFGDLARQLEQSLDEAERECEVVGRSLQSMSNAKSLIEGTCCGDPEERVVRSCCDSMGRSLDAAVIALQYQDRLAQQVNQTRNVLDQLQIWIQSENTLNPAGWLRGLKDIERTSAAEHDRIARHRGVPEGDCGIAPHDAESSVELF